MKVSTVSIVQGVINIYNVLEVATTCLQVHGSCFTDKYLFLFFSFIFMLVIQWLAYKFIFKGFWSRSYMLSLY
jgi:hypothetical protein